MSFRFRFPAFLFLLLALSLLGRAAQAGPPAAAATPSLAEALNPDGTLRAGAAGSFDARQFTMQTAPDGRPVFRPNDTKGAGDFRWADGFGLPNGTNGRVNAVVRVGTDVYIGGDFTVVGDVVATCVAKWNGTVWSSLGTGSANGVHGEVRALAVSGSGEVYVAGLFTKAGGVMANYIAKWNGTAWSSLGTGAGNGVDGDVKALAVSGSGEVYVAGLFSHAGGVMAYGVAKWNGTAWSGLGTGTVARGVFALAVSGSGDVYIGGQFTTVDGVAANNIAKWNGTAWSSLGTGAGNGVDGAVSALAVSGSGDVYAGGVFTQAGGVMANGVAKWNGTAWSSLGTGTGARGVFALAVSGSGDVYIGGQFTTVDGVAANYVAKWNGTAWSSLGTGAANGVNDFVWALAVSGSGDVYAGGVFTQAGGVAANRVAKWNGTAWSSLGTGAGNGVDGAVSALAVSGSGDVYAGGVFTQVGGVAANNIAKWNGTTWSSLGTGAANGVNREVVALAVSGSGDVYAGGVFTQAGGVAANRVAKWNGTAWSSLGTGTGNGITSTGGLNIVRALAVSGSGEVYAGGYFSEAGGMTSNNIAKWNGTAWSSLGAGAGNGVDNAVVALAVSGSGEVYAGGYFRWAGGMVVNHVAKWNGTTWSSLGTGAANGVNDFVWALAVSGSGEVYVGGFFFEAGGMVANRVAKWNGTAWSSFGTGIGTGVSGFVWALAVSGSGDVYVGGDCDQAGGVAATNIAKWDGTAWSALGTGLNNRVLGMALGSNNKLYVGGIFGGVGNMSKASSGFAVYDPTAVNDTIPAALHESLSLFPNPAHGPATLTLPPAATARAGEVLDGLGRVLRSFVVAGGAGTAALPVGGLPAGAYVVRVGAATGRLVVE